MKENIKIQENKNYYDGEAWVVETKDGGSYYGPITEIDNKTIEVIGFDSKDDKIINKADITNIYKD